MKRNLFTFLVFAVALLASAAGRDEAVRWSWSFTMTGPSAGEAVFKAVMAPGWHLYASDAQSVPAPLKISFTETEGVEADGKLTSDRRPVETYNDILQARQTWWADSVVVRRRFEITSENAVMKGTIRYSACDDNTCMPPQTVNFILRVPSRDIR